MWLPGKHSPPRVFANASRLYAIAALAAVALDAAAPAARAMPPAVAKPQGQPSVELSAQCLLCHGADLITQQKLTRAAWSRELDKMVKWGAVVATDERERMLDALAARFAPARSSSQETSSTTLEGAPDVFTRSCLTCHERDLITQQRLTRTGWAREVEKMIRWGAPVSEADKSALIDFLTSRYPVR